jgi:hypothetical protein
MTHDPLGRTIPYDPRSFGSHDPLGRLRYTPMHGNGPAFSPLAIAATITYVTRSLYHTMQWIKSVYILTACAGIALAVFAIQVFAEGEKAGLITLQVSISKCR